MSKKLRTIKWMIIANLFLTILSSFGQNRFNVICYGGANLSQPFALPGNLTRNGNDYQVTYLPGYAIAGLFQFNITPQFALASGVGYKNLNFHFTKIFKPAYYEMSIFLAKLHYYIIPFEFRLNLTRNKKYFLLIGGEFAWLVRDVNYELLFWQPNVSGAREYGADIYKWFKSESRFLILGSGIQINPKAAIIIQAGFTVARVDQPELPIEGGETSNFYFSKKLAELHVLFQYNVF